MFKTKMCGFDFSGKTLKELRENYKKVSDDPVTCIYFLSSAMGKHDGIIRTEKGKRCGIEMSFNGRFWDTKDGHEIILD